MDKIKILTKLKSEKMKVIKFGMCIVMVLLIGLTSCGDDEKEKNGCTGIPTIEGTAEFNGETGDLSIAQLLISSNFNQDDYLFQVTSISDDCSNTKTMTFYVGIPENTTIGGTYEIKDFFDAGVNDAHGSYTVQNLVNLSQSLLEMESGSVHIVKEGTSKYSIDVDAILIGGEQVSMKVTTEF